MVYRYNIIIKWAIHIGIVRRPGGVGTDLINGSQTKRAFVMDIRARALLPQMRIDSQDHSQTN